MIMRRLRYGAQLIHKPPSRRVAAYAYLTLGAAVTLAANLYWQRKTKSQPDNVIEVLYLIVALVFLSAVSVRMERGRLTLASIAIGAASILLNPLDATIVGLSLGIPMVRRGLWPIMGAVMASTYACFGAIVAAQLRVGGTLPLPGRAVVLIVINLASWILVGIGLALRSGESIRSIVKHNFGTQFYLPYGYFALASLLTSYFLDGSLRGYLLATIVFVLALALTDTIAGRRIRRVLESELSDADRHLFHSRAIEGVVHNLRNHMAPAIGYLKEIDPHRLDPVDRDAMETATAAANDAVTVLRTLSQGATPRVTSSTEPIELNELATRALGMARPRARAKELEVGLRESPDEVKVTADPLLLREVFTNLVNNAIAAAPTHGHVELTTGRRSNCWPYFSVADNGPGVSEDNRHHLFEPHFTTQETDTGPA